MELIKEHSKFHHHNHHSLLQIFDSSVDPGMSSNYQKVAKELGFTPDEKLVSEMVFHSFFMKAISRSTH